MKGNPKKKEDETKTNRNLAKNHFQNKKIFEKKQKKTPRGKHAVLSTHLPAG